MAALTAARGGADVILAEETPEVGGRLLSDRQEIDGRDAASWVAGMLADLKATGRVRLMTRTTVTGVYDDGLLRRAGTGRAPCRAGPPTCRRTASGASARPTRCWPQGAHESVPSPFR